MHFTINYFFVETIQVECKLRSRAFEIMAPTKI